MSTRRSARATAGQSSSSGGSRRAALEEIRRLREASLNGGNASDSHSESESDGDHAHHADDDVPQDRKARRRSSGLSRVAQYKPQESSIFQTVTEEEYEQIVRKRRQEMPFVENDDGEMGYFDDGEETFFESDPEVDGDARNHQQGPDEDPNSRKRSAGALSSSYIRRAKRMQRAKLGNGNDQKITSMFFSASNSVTGKNATGAASKGPAAALGGANHAKGRRARGNVKRDIDLDSLLDDLERNPTDDFATSGFQKPVAYGSVSSFNASGSRRTAGVKSSAARGPKIMELDEEEEEEEDQQLPVHHDAIDHNDNDMDGYEYDGQPNDNVGDQVMEDSAESNRDAKEPEHETNEEEEEVEKAKPVLSKRELLLQKARQTSLKTTAPTARALAGASMKTEVKGEPATSTATKNSSHALLGEVPSNEVAEWWQIDQPAVKSEADQTESTADPTAPLAAESSDKLRMYWMDAVEVRERPGKLYLIGKVRVSPASQRVPTYKSCCVVVNNLERYLYVVPKIPEALQAKYQSKASSPEAEITMKDLSKDDQQELWMKMHQEIHSLLIPSCISLRKDQERFHTKLVWRNYAFELDSIPRGKNLYLKVKYPAKYPAPPADFCLRDGQYFSRICGATTRPLENFLIRRKLLGPGWLEIDQAVKGTESVSFCCMEFECFDPKHVHPLAGSGQALAPPPPLTVMSLSIKSFCNPMTQQHEILALSTITETGVSSEGGKDSKSQQEPHHISHFTAIRPLDSACFFPQAYVQGAQDDPRFRQQESLRLEANERALLSFFLTKVQREDPDVIVGHNLHKYGLDLLVSRIDHFKLGGLWSKLTRLRRGRIQPLNMGEGWNEYRMDDLINGRLLCDTYVSSKELLPSQNNYTLSHLVQVLLNKQRMEVEMNDLHQIMASGPANFVKLLRHTLDDAMFVLHVMHQLEVLPLTKQLSNLCGYLWSRTLEANKRAERIEYLLLHEFNVSKHKFLVPEKFKNNSKDGDGSKKSRKREASYAGGMVFAPKKGLYDNFVVLLDFNSLYPSIIREYNICFTTVERTLTSDQAMGKSSNSKKPKKHPKGKKDPNERGEDDDEIDELAATSTGAEEESDIPALPSANCEEGILPSVIKRLLESRKQVKQQLKAETRAGNMAKVKQLDIRQKAIKLTANSMYGCLGFRFSRFYAKPIAALITSTGRQTLQRAKEVAEQECGYDVIYGDTDSIMVDSRSDKLEEAQRIGREIQVQCNKHFKLLEIEVDYIFKAILLLNKKKYAALVVKELPSSAVAVPGAPNYRIEKDVKGLDMVRRDWCVISKAMGNAILDFILSGKSRDEVVEQIHEHLRKCAQRIRNEEEPLEQFVITKSLNKQPELYPDKSKQYHVQVALALKQQGKPIGAGSHIPYVICKEEEPGTGRRAYHPDEVKRSNGKLSVDFEWYLEAQIHPPVNRLCAHIEGTSSAQLAHCMGLDTAKFAHNMQNLGSENDDDQDAIPSVLQHDEDRFRNCQPLELVCGKCKCKNAFPGVYWEAALPGSTGSKHWQSGLYCVAPECGAEFWGFDQEGILGQVGDDLFAVLSNRLHLATREATRKYYEGWVVCSDVTCKTRTQKQSLRGNGDICSAPGCRGTVAAEFSDQMLYTQMKFFDSLFDIERAQDKFLVQQTRQKALTSLENRSLGQHQSDGQFPPLPETHRQVLNKLHTQIQKTVQLNEYNWVKPSIWQTLFT